MQARTFFCSKLIDLITAIEGDGEAWSTWDSDMAVEARNPGQVDRRNPLWFEQPLHSPIADQGFWDRSLTMTYSHMGRPHTTIGDASFHF